MNRLFILGNGFDLAHGLKTSYDHFIAYYLKKALKELNDKNTQSEDSPFYFADRLTTFKFPKDRIESISTISDFNNFIENFKSHVKWPRTKNQFIEELLENEHGLCNWNDIEYFYFDRLKQIINETNGHSHYNLDLTSIKKLNTDFDEIKRLLESYLVMEIQPKITSLGIAESPFQHLFEASEGFRITASDKNSLRTMQYCVLNFNYTTTVKLYVGQYVSNPAYQLINIHGELANEENPMIFGYGDDRNEEYRHLENFNRREFLENLKYFSYLRTSNYKNLIDFMEKDDFEVRVIGHSCGLSDRTILSRIFQSKRCDNIIIYHYKGYDGYRSVVEGISRHISDKSALLQKVKEYDPLDACPSHCF